MDRLALLKTRARGDSVEKTSKSGLNVFDIGQSANITHTY
jgi:hypothetical protein